ncbi:hypothetical protein GCM10009566_42780 [Streptomyces murinus]|uniref:Uncharacterized protein n=1 Tax=Streptomyces murinus TaxID=33900 RepID=A0A7W3NHY1_STRMR|nr:hypothetical protein [Streptomyces murinus]MBA9050884.1 hypothetical protein [Streptomyces murinus]
MPRTIWSGAISFGLVTVPIHVVSATEDHPSDGSAPRAGENAGAVVDVGG